MHKVTLKSEPISGALGFLHWGLEHFVFGRFQYFKNHPRGNYVLLSACITACTISVVFALALISVRWGQELFLGHSLAFPALVASLANRAATLGLRDSSQYLLGLISMISVVYWGNSRLLNSKWLYCQGLYNDIVKLQCRNRLDRLTHDVLVNSLAMDLLVLDLWAHRLFSEMFSQELKRAIRNTTKGPYKGITLQRMKGGTLTESEAMKLLETRQKVLFDQISAEEKVLRDRQSNLPKVIELSKSVGE